MVSSIIEPGPGGAPSAALETDAFGEFERASVAGWAVRRYGTIASTQDAAASLPPWSAATAEIQTAGRGQWQRSFTSDRGGLYLTAVLPYDGNAARWRGFALAVGLAVVSNFRAQSVADLRLRWPNDLMVGGRKAGGILVSQAKPDTLCVGLGLNVNNRPWLEDPGLEAACCRLADVAPGHKLDFRQLSQLLLGAIRAAYVGFSLRGLGGIVDRLNECWGGARDVRVERAPESPEPEISGRFVGVLADGDLILADSLGRRTVVRAHLVKRLRER
jgi:BirA family transcriptional regulator, biotin operon repressor / biotin---[acetyl-CoA-carboxylase] ligase